MSEYPRAPRGPKWRMRTAVAAVPAVLLALLTSVMSSQAVVTTPFLIDGEVPDTGAVEFVDGHLGDKELGPTNGNTTKVGPIHMAAKPMLSTTNPNGQTDLYKIWLDTKTDGSDDAWLYFAFQRDSNTGSGFVMYEFQQAPEPAGCDYSLTNADLIAGCNPWENRQPGDFILVFDQQGNTVDIYLRYFMDASPGGADWVKGDPLVLQTSTIDLVDAGTAAATMSADGYRGEAAVNLTDTIFANAPDGCTTIGNIIPGTVTGNSDTADYKDTVLQDLADAVTISNCGSVTIIKETDPDDLSGTFPYTLSRSGGDDVNYDDEDGATITGTLTEDGDSDTHQDLIAAGDYTLAEGSVGPEFALTDITCVTGEGEDEVSVNVYPDGDDFPVVVGENTTCTITNEQQRGTLQIQKVLINDHNGPKDYDDFSYSVNGATAVPFANGTVISQSVLVGTYDVSEPEANSGGYATTYSGTDGSGTTAECDDLVVTVGSIATCVITNNDQPGKLIVQKVLINDNNGSKGYGDFSWSVDGGTATAFVSGTAVETEVDAGTYDVSEPEANDAGYTTSYSGTDLNGSETDCDDLVIPNGGQATCVVTNDDQQGKLIVQKVLTNDNGGSADYGDFSWSVDGGTATAFVSGTAVETAVDAGTYDVSEPEANSGGYATTYSGTDGSGTADDCDDLVVPNGGSATCVITNDDEKAEPTGTTVQSWVLHDTFALIGLRAGAPDAADATATFSLYSDATCETQVGDSEEVGIAAGAAATVDGVEVFDSDAYYYWLVAYSGDQYNEAFTTDCGQEITQILAADDKDGGRDDFAV